MDQRKMVNISDALTLNTADDNFLATNRPGAESDDLPDMYARKLDEASPNSRAG